MNSDLKSSGEPAIGGLGFGFKRNENGFIIPYQRNEHKYGVKIDFNVEIGSYTCIDRGSWRDTEIKQGVKIDNLVHIGHNSIIDEHTLIVAGTVVGGSCNIGKRCFLGMNCSIKQHVTIGDDVVVGAGAVVLNDVPSGLTVVGNPAYALLNGNPNCVLCGLQKIDKDYKVCPRCKGRLKKNESVSK